jgi:hypothetical protein
MTATVSQLHPQAATRPASKRNEALDWTKGALIVFMVIYHAINYSNTYRPVSFQYLDFLPPSFILITGFLVGQVYATKYDLNSWQPYVRLAIRGFKLLVLFTLLNLANNVVYEKSLYHGFWRMFDNGISIFVWGTGRVAIFEVLLPIAYFLLLAPLLLWLRAQVRTAVPIMTAVIMGLCLFLESRGIVSDNLILLSAGFLGMSLGLISFDRINRFASLWLPSILCYVGYQVSKKFFGGPYWIQMLGATTTLALLYCLARHLKPGHLFQQFVQLGNYSLFAYLFQIALLQAALRILGRPEQWILIAGWIVATLVLVWFAVVALDCTRKRNKPVDGAYKLVFA